MDLDRILPILIPFISHVADFEKVVTRMRELIVQKRIRKEVVVRGSKRCAVAIANENDRVDVLLQVVNAVLQPLRANVKAERLAGFDRELEVVHILGFLDCAADGRGQGDGVRLIPSVVATLLLDDGIFSDHQLAECTDTRRRADAEISNAGQRV